MRVVNSFGREVKPGELLFTTNAGVAYRLVRAGAEAFDGALVVKAVGYLYGEMAEGPERWVSASRFAVTVRRVQ